MARRPAPKGANTIQFSMDTSGLDRLLGEWGETLTQSAPAIAAAGAKVVYDEVHKNVDSMGTKTGNLKKSIYRKLSEEKSDRAKGKIVYNVSWNYKKAPHGRLLEWGWWQRYQVYVGLDGKWYTKIKPGVKGKVKKPGKNATQAQRDAYYVPMKGGPRYRQGYAFIRRAQSSFPRALQAMETEIIKRIGQL